MFKFTLESALKAKKQGKLHQWVLDYLNGEGKNKKLAKILKEEKYFWSDMFEYPLNKLKRVMGPEKGMIFHEENNKWEKRVIWFMNCLEKGESLPPIIVTDFWKDIHISDGSHRYEALKKSGYEKYWTIFYIKKRKQQTSSSE